jgi:hypothetical protein
MHFFRTTKLAQKAEYPRMIWLRRYLHSVRYLAAPLFALRALLAARYLLLLLRLLTFDFRR